VIVFCSSDVLAPYLPTKPRCMEIFARYLLPGWTSWGCEVLKLQHLSLYVDRGHEIPSQQVNCAASSGVKGSSTC
jgi:hypothetical protein